MPDRLSVPVKCVLQEVLVNCRVPPYPGSHEGSHLSALDLAHMKELSGI